MGTNLRSLWYVQLHTVLFVLADEQKHIIVKIGEKHISVIFDSTTWSGEVLAEVIRFVAE